MSIRFSVMSTLRAGAFILATGISGALATAAVGAQPAPASENSSATIGRLSIEKAWARATVPGAAVGGGFVSIRNEGDDDRLTGANSPVAARVELHTMTMQDGVMRMRQLEAIELPAGKEVELRPGGHHLMLMDLARPLEEGESFPVTLRFEKAGEIEVQVQVLSLGARGAAQHGAGATSGMQGGAHGGSAGQGTSGPAVEGNGKHK
jgi:copper(I)-binding protein